MTPLRRRGLIALLTVVVVATVSCDRLARVADLPTIDSSTGASDDVVDVPPFRPLRGEVYVGLKRTAGRVVQQLTTYAATDSWRSLVRRVTARFDVSPHALGSARAVYASSTSSVGEIVYPQLGGLALATTPQTAAVMVVVQQTLNGEDVVTRTFDVRLRFESESWRVDSVESAGGDPADGEVSAVASAVLENPGIELADSARWDIYRGEVDERLLRLMGRLARRYTYSVTVLKSGHPPHVYGTEQVSNHTVGRAVDIWEVDERPVVTQRKETSSAAYRLTEDVFERGEVPEIGSPWDLDGGGSRSFTNDVHLDHIHLAYDAAG